MAHTLLRLRPPALRKGTRRARSYHPGYITRFDYRDINFFFELDDFVEGLSPHAIHKSPDA